MSVRTTMKDKAVEDEDGMVFVDRVGHTGILVIQHIPVAVHRNCRHVVEGQRS